MSTDEPVVSLDDVRIEFSKSQLFGLAQDEIITAVNDVSLDIHENDVVALVGESGCGKTTLGKTAIGLNRPAGGAVRYRGQDIFETKDQSGPLSRLLGDDLEYSFSEIRRSLQIIHQDPESSLDANDTVEGILAEPLERWQPELDKRDRRERIYAFLDYVGMAPPEDFAARYPHEMSGGQQQRVALVRALLMEPDLILADESISALDVSLRVGMMDLMIDLQETVDTSYLFITHDISTARYMAERAGGRIGVMYLGEIVEIGPVEEVIHNPQHPYTKALLWATPDMGSQEALGQTQRLEDAPLRRLDIPDLEDPPSGCHFHTRCPKARAACTEEAPEPTAVGEAHEVSCFRNQDDHRYWESEPLSEDVEMEISDRR
jgi:peptide/nickel transport system ATP-binding protein